MNGYGSRIRFGEMVIANFKELFNNVVRRCGSVNEKQIIMCDPSIRKEILVVLLFVQPYDSGDIELIKYFYVLVWMMSIPLHCISFLNRSHESHKFAWDDPVDITVFNSLEMFIFLYIESLEIIPLEFNGIL